MSRRVIDLNCDLGESRESVASGVEAALLEWVTSANVACGGHAGDDFTMTETVRAAAGRRAAVGAHPAFPDRARFGRVELWLSPQEVEDVVAGQIASLGRIAKLLGVALAHVKPHGALYHAAMRRSEIAEAVARAAARWSRGLVLVGQAGALALDVWRSRGFRAAGEAFADRRYEPGGSLRSRAFDDALITDPAEAAAQALRLANGAGAVDTICVHGDTPNSVAIARAVREALAASGFDVKPPAGS